MTSFYGRITGLNLKLNETAVLDVNETAAGRLGCKNVIVVNAPISGRIDNLGECYQHMASCLTKPTLR